MFGRWTFYRNWNTHWDINHVNFLERSYKPNLAENCIISAHCNKWYLTEQHNFQFSTCMFKWYSSLGPLGCWCGRYWLWVSSLTLLALTLKCCTMWEMQEDLTDLKTVLMICKCLFHISYSAHMTWLSLNFTFLNCNCKNGNWTHFSGLWIWHICLYNRSRNRKQE